jgi:tRNA dimethylallyltransferase
LGYQQVLALGDTQQAREQTVTATRRFVRRQRSWFRRDPRVRWLDAAEPDLVAAALTLVR